ncbi:NADH oxidoreductase [Rahnella sp. SAP-1]|uniref:NADH oxidoreductase n=1 Tax=Rouxiella aceris TaxID=2703884 RepID=A0A848MJ85_9GAMM|nr:NADH oxidoreductase [Rouxiella aceris]NMP27140.1 NADH oxidoreductase [Rouxiella aceris]
MTAILFPDQPSALCPNRMQVYAVTQETPNVWTLSLFTHDRYDYRPGQFALVNIGTSGLEQRAYTLSSTPGVSRFIELTVKLLPGGCGSTWLTGEVKPGDYLWLSDAQGEFTADGDRPLVLLAAGCGITPVMSICRDALRHQPAQPIQVFYSIHQPEDMIFAAQWQQLVQQYPQLKLHILCSQNAQSDMIAGRLSQALLAQHVTDIHSTRVMICGPNDYMQQAKSWVLALGCAEENIISEAFYTPEPAVNSEQRLLLTSSQPLQHFSVKVGASLLSALEQYSLPVVAACRAGVCGSCKTRILSGHYRTTSQATLTADELAQGYVLACSCQLETDITLA